MSESAQINHLTEKNDNIQDRIQDFLIQHNRENATITSMASDLGSRRFWRIENPHAGTSAPKSEILMHFLPSDHPNFTPGHALEDYVRLGRNLLSHNVRVPEIYEIDPQQGFCLAEDFGPLTFLKATEQPELGQSNDELTRLAARALKNIQKIEDDSLLEGLENILDSRIYGIRQTPDARPFAGHFHFIDSYCPILRDGAPEPDGLAPEYDQVWCGILDNLPPIRQGFIHLDFHFENLMLAASKNPAHGPYEAGVIDFQGAMQGPCVYDLTNLLQDARRTTDPATQKEVFDHFISDMTAEDKEAFGLWYDVMACQFHCRVIGQFIFLSKRMNKNVHLNHLPRLAHYIEENTKNIAVLKPLRQWMESYKIDMTQNAPKTLEEIL